MAKQTPPIPLVVDEATRILDEGPVLDGNGNPVPVPDHIEVDGLYRAFMAGRVPAKKCGHYIAKSEARAGFTRCERCQRERTIEVGRYAHGESVLHALKG